MSVATMDPPLQSELLSIKHTQDAMELYPNHAFAKGGVGQFLATGARGGIHRLPQTLKAARVQSGRSAASAYSEESGPVSLAGISSINASLAAQAPMSAAKVWEQNVKHPHNFLTASRTARRWDVPPASKWAAVSFYENDPKEVARHLTIVNYLEDTHTQGKMLEREIERTRHNDWTAQQRETFRRQRLEQAARYARSGMRPRSAYADLGATAAVSELQASMEHQQPQQPQPQSPYFGGPNLSSAADPRVSSASGRSYASAAASQPPAAGVASSVKASFSIPALQRPMTAGPGTSWRNAMHSGTASTTYSPRGASWSPARAASASKAVPGASGGSFMSILQSTRPDSGAKPLPTSIPLPKPTYTKVYARIAAEQAEHPAAKVAADAERRAQEARMKEVQQLDSEVQELDQFESHLRHIQRSRSRAAAERTSTTGDI